MIDVLQALQVWNRKAWSEVKIDRLRDIALGFGVEYRGIDDIVVGERMAPAHAGGDGFSIVFEISLTR
ncbi:hypothetical protein [Rhizobium sp. G21]|uniref:hypothetical protein n=1 Tax=Rhizobium sp. G21 TaxID=2758439 RepID=UPI001600B898|nr:hypothetical protein [Rhizobium sp. G21]MBB1251303.1 hypothetical protein [Rhizobium sp. G21]